MLRRWTIDESSASPREMSLPALYPLALDDQVATTGPDSPAGKLEQGHILFIADAHTLLPPAQDLAFLRTQLHDKMALKNISYHPDEKVLSGLKGDAALKANTSRILSDHDQRVRNLLHRWLPKYAAAWRVGKVNYRPLEEEGRALSRHSSNELIHVDAYASGATHGGRVLRFFVNCNESEPRLWRSSGVFADLYRDLRRDAGLDKYDGAHLEEGPLDKAYSGLLRGLTHAGLKMAQFADRSPYDKAMKVLHDYMKDSDAFQRDTKRHVDLQFAPLTAWAVMTDGVSHACLKGRHALVNTYYIPLEAAEVPEWSPYHLMRQAA